MGIFSSKFKTDDHIDHKSGATNEFHTPAKSLKLNDDEEDEYLDPRSPTNNIFRTPLGPSPRKNGAITKTQNLTRIDEVCMTPLQNDRLVKTMKQNPLDPRSPSTFIDRTPMVFKDEPVLKNDTIPSVEFNEITNDSIDFVESMDHMKIDPRSPSFDILRTPLVFNDTIEEDEFKDIEDDISDEPEFKEIIVEPIEIMVVNTEKDPRSPSIDIERTPLVLKESVEIIPEKVEKTVKIFQIVDESESDDSSKSQKYVETITVMSIKPKETNDAKSLLKNIYQDENVKYSTPNKKLTVTDEKQRTPLSCVANKTGSKLVKLKSNSNIKGRMVYDENKCVTPTIFSDNEDVNVIKSANLSNNNKSRIPVFRQK